ncbi:MAG: acyl carrier protein [Bilifractor sp.]|nr:acyl carrier protein [Bilifractor sp.]
MEFQLLQQIIVEILHVDPREVTMNTTFAEDLGADSLDLFQIAALTDEKFEIEITEDEFLNIKTAGDLVKLIRNKTSKPPHPAGGAPHTV